MKRFHFPFTFTVSACLVVEAETLKEALEIYFDGMTANEKAAKILAEGETSDSIDAINADWNELDHGTYEVSDELQEPRAISLEELAEAAKD